ncbi:hypothetical protein [Novosphingobium umbonatum]|nr:hypothetical protein [Novosphingobium umbonatum]
MLLNLPFETSMRVAFQQTKGDPKSPLGRLIVNKMRAGVGIRWPRRPKK